MDVIESPAEAVQPIKFGKGRRDALIKHLQDETNAIINDREGKLAKWRDWVDQANSRLKRKDAGPRDANLDMTITRERLSATSARLQTPIQQQDQTMVAKPRVSGPMSHDLSLSTERFMDWMLDRAEMMILMDEWIEQFQTVPFGCVKTPWVREVTKIKRWEEIQDIEPNPEDPMDEGTLAPEIYAELKEMGEPVVRRTFEDGTARYFRELEEDKVVREGCFPFVIPAEDVLFIDAPNPDTSPLFTHRVWLTKEQIALRIKEGVYEKLTPDKKKVLDAIGTPSSERKPLMGIEENKEDDDEASGNFQRYEVLESYLCFDCGQGPTEIIVTWERASGVILRAAHNWYHKYHRPFVMTQFKRVIGSMYGIPQVFQLEPLHRAYSASINQRLDAASRANEVAVMVPPMHPMLKQMDRDYVRGGIYENPGYGENDVQTFNVSQPFTQLPQLEETFEHRADRVSNLGPASWGEEPANRPTATGSLQANEELKQPQYLQLERFIRPYSLVVRHMVARYEQAYPEGVRYYAQADPEGMQLVEQWFNWPDGDLEDQVLIETKVSSATMSKMTRKQEVIALLDKIPQIYQAIMQLGQMAAEPGNPMGIISVKLLGGLQAIFDKFLKEFDVGEREELNPDLIQEVQVVRQIQEAMAQMQQAIQQAQQANANLQAENAWLKGVGGPGGVGGASGQQPGPPGPSGMAVPPVQQSQ